MSEPRAGRPGRGLLAVMAAVLTLALIVFGWGVLSLVLDQSVISEADAGPLVGPAMVASVCALVFSLALRGRPADPIARGVLAGLGSLVAATLVGAIVYGLARGQAAAVPVFFGGHILNLFTIVAALIAAAVVTAAAIVSRIP